METVNVNGVQLEYEVTGSGEPVLLISPLLAEGFLPLLRQPDLTDHFRLIRYSKRGWGGSTHTPPPVTIADHASDAAALLEYLDLHPAHVVGHSSGGAVALQLAVDHPRLVHTLVLLEPALMSVPSAQAFLEKAGPSFELYRSGRAEDAVVYFLSAVSGLDAETCRATIERHVPDAVPQAVSDAETFFDIELPALMQWEFGPEQAGRIVHSILSVRGTATERLFKEAADLLQSWISTVEDFTVEGVGHLLHLQRPAPIAEGIGAFFGRHSIKAVEDLASPL